MTKRTKICLATVCTLLLLLLSAWGIMALRFPYYHQYRKMLDLSPRKALKYCGWPDKDLEWLLSMDVEAFRGDWEKVSRYSAEDRHSMLGTYFYNLSNAMQGRLGEGLMDHYQPFERGLFLPVNSTATKFAITSAGEVWYRLGEMTMAEHSAILGLIFSPEHYGPRYLMRLAQINLINGEEEAATKYLRMLEGHRGYRQWAEEHLPGNETEDAGSWLSRMRSLVPKNDIVHYASDARASLRILVDANPNNIAAREYLLCYDLLVKDLDSFVKDYEGSGLTARVYQEGILIYLASNGILSEENVAAYPVSEDVLSDFFEFSDIYQKNSGAMAPLEGKFGKTYMFYYRFAKRNEK